MPFDKEYSLQLDEVVIRTFCDKHLRVDPKNEDFLDGDGGTGKWARFYVEKLSEGIVQIKSKHTGRYIRIIKVGDEYEINVSGGGGRFTPFKVHDQGDGKVKLESQAFEGRYISVPGAPVKVGTGGKFCALRFFTD